ncbi:hypothetical protein PVAND_009271 [Polypedilum vanderplanki]|uniref:Uncharacterized protein n=1 Tax=Polypedilum vanderplanki TaxID=319348 RepID=A0A9J6CC75_POLVA|nr:hypothetical protein PVAND_009271 [Polypedilum vanderplanki]
MGNDKMKEEDKSNQSSYQVQESRSRIDLPEFVPINTPEYDDFKSQNINEYDSRYYSDKIIDQKCSTSSHNSVKRESKSEAHEENSNHKRKHYTESRDHHPYHQRQIENKEYHKNVRKKIRYHSRSPRYRSNSPHDNKSKYYRYGKSYDDYDCEDNRQQGRSDHHSRSFKNNRSVFSRLGTLRENEVTPPSKISRIYYEDEENHPYEPYSVQEISDERILYRNSDTDDSLTRRLNIVVHCSEDYDRSRSVVYNNQLDPSEVISAIQNLEFDQQALIQRCNDLKVKVEPLFREISTLETMVLMKTQELEALKRKVNYF